MTLSGATNPGQIGPRIDGNEGVFYIPKAQALLALQHQTV